MVDVNRVGTSLVVMTGVLGVTMLNENEVRIVLSLLAMSVPAIIAAIIAIRSGRD